MSEIAAATSQESPPTSKSAEKLYQLLVRPQGVGPLYWPHTIDYDERHGKFVRFLFALADDSGGYSTVIEGSTFTANELEVAVIAWWEEHDDDPWPWEFRMVEVG